VESSSRPPLIDHLCNRFAVLKVGSPKMSQPHFEGSVRSPLTLPKMGLESPLGLPKTQSSIARVKTPCLEVFFIPLESSWSVDVQNGLSWIIWKSVAQVMVERRAGSQTGVKLVVWLLTTKSRELTRPRCVQVECNMPLKSSQGELQVCLRPHRNRRSEQEVMNAQSLGSPNRTISGLPLGSPGTKGHLDMAPVEWRKVYYMGEGGGFPWVRAVVSQVSLELPMACPSTKFAP
jgi:hypothetical protein